MDRGTIRDRARLLLGEPTSGGGWSDTQYNTAINEAQDDVAIRTKCLKTYAEFTTADATSEYSIAEASLANFIDIAEVWYFWDTDSYDVLDSIGRDELAFRQNNYRGNSGTPTAFCYEDRVIEFDCETEASLACRVYYYKLPATLSADSSVSLIPTKFHQTLVYYTAWKFCESDGLDPNRTGYFKNQYMEEIAKMRSILVPPASTYTAIKDDTSGY
jgi:hypothetical protein